MSLSGSTRLPPPATPPSARAGNQLTRPPRRALQGRPGLVVEQDSALAASSAQMVQATSSLAAHLSTLSAPATAAALVRMASAAAAYGASCAVSLAAPPGGAAPPGWPDLKAEARAVSAPPRAPSLPRRAARPRPRRPR